MRATALLSPMALTALLSSLASLANAQDTASSMSLCDKYSTALFQSVNATSQSTLLTALVNTAVIGSYSPLGSALQVPGILANGTFNNQPVSLLKYFDGSLKSTNVKGQAQAVNFLDGGGAEPLKENKPANDTGSAQYVLMTHLYQYFGAALGCSSQSANGDFPTYQGSVSMSSAHRFMNLDENEVGYFITQVGMAAVSFGVSTEDATAVGTLLGSLFNVRCAPPVSFPPGGREASQSICLASSCPLANMSDCTPNPAARSYPNGTNGVEAEAVMGAPPTTTTSAGGSDSSQTTGSAPASGAAPIKGAVAWTSSLATFAALGMGALGVATLL